MIFKETGGKNVHLGITMCPKNISHISLVSIGEEKSFNIFSKAIDEGCFLDVYWDVVYFLNSACLCFLVVS